MSKESREALVYSSTKGCSLKTRVGFLALENTELVCISFGVFLPRMGPPKPHTPHKSIISLPPYPPSPLDDRHLIFLSSWQLSSAPGPDPVRHNPWVHPVLSCVEGSGAEQRLRLLLETSSSYSRAPGGGMSTSHRHLHHKDGVPLCVRKHMWIGD